MVGNRKRPSPAPNAEKGPGGTERNRLRVGTAIAVAAASLMAGANERPPQDDDGIRKSLRGISLLMLEFNSEYGSFPNRETLGDVCEATGHAAWPLKSSNDHFRQLFAVAAGAPEKAFSDGGRTGWSRTPDEVTRPLPKALEPGECVFAYIPPEEGAPANRPMLLYPVMPGGRTFDPEPLAGRALVMTLGGKTLELPIGKEGRATLDGKDLFDPSQPFWNGSAPVVFEPAR